VANPTLYFARMMASALRRRGIEVQGGVADFDDLAAPLPVPAGTPLFVRSSPPLRDLAQPMMKESLNLDAETLLRAVGRQSGGAASIEDGRTVASETLASWNLPPDAIVQADGSGLSRYNLVTADALVEILRRMYDDPRHRDSWMAALPVGGQDGTLQRRFKGTQAEGLVRAKTGTLFSVRALGGYVPAARGELLAFAIVVNNTTAPGREVMASVDAAVSRLAAFSR
jgi:D-alanyl-D-alanine carboxypeptidase/D-alanyl-D-alanine-endopeptidase (penicillin-binding protein 4)